ncbi:hypothetical protein GALMADRAFT_225566 [Galerina marginata CBS 339.88]|uniref:Uncharacterized protein n=1 Tax=Galerina marginata (strain CBS 339.88) TaxID=685588 RepID=A0A067T014_GALM3|nr:hypothetical protein GALMADRAFT_225566 [Galerina marginata CBS 339.88]
MQRNLLRTIGEAPERPKRGPLLISSRPESHIRHVFNQDLIFRRLHVQTFNPSSDNVAHHDIKVFLSKQFDEFKFSMLIAQIVIFSTDLGSGRGLLSV